MSELLLCVGGHKHGKMASIEEKWEHVQFRLPPDPPIPLRKFGQAGDRAVHFEVETYRRECIAFDLGPPSENPWDARPATILGFLADVRLQHDFVREHVVDAILNALENGEGDPKLWGKWMRIFMKKAKAEAKA